MLVSYGNRTDTTDGNVTLPVAVDTTVAASVFDVYHRAKYNHVN